MNPSLEICPDIRIEKERRPKRVIIQDGDYDIVALIQKVPLNAIIFLILREQLADAVLTNFIDGEVPELIHCLQPLRPQSGFRLHFLDPSRQLNKKTLGPLVAEILRAGLDRLKNAADRGLDNRTVRGLPRRSQLLPCPIRPHRTPLCRGCLVCRTTRAGGHSETTNT